MIATLNTLEKKKQVARDRHGPFYSATLLRLDKLKGLTSRLTPSSSGRLLMGGRRRRCPEEQRRWEQGLGPIQNIEPSSTLRLETDAGGSRLQNKVV